MVQVFHATPVATSAAGHEAGNEPRTPSHVVGQAGKVGGPREAPAPEDRGQGDERREDGRRTRVVRGEPDELPRDVEAGPAADGQRGKRQDEREPPRPGVRASARALLRRGSVLVLDQSHSHPVVWLTVRPQAITDLRVLPPVPRSPAKPRASLRAAAA